MLNIALSCKNCGNKDLNTIWESGIYICSSSDYASTDNNFPVPAKGYLVVHSSLNKEGSGCQQIYYRHKGNVYTRTYWDGSWSTWIKLMTDIDINPISNALNLASNINKTNLVQKSDVTHENYEHLDNYNFYCVKNGICYFQINCRLSGNIASSESFFPYYLPASLFGNYLYFTSISIEEGTEGYITVRIDSNGNVRIAGNPGTYHVVGSYPIA